MQSTNSRDSATTSSSTETLTHPKLKCPILFISPPPLPELTTPEDLPTLHAQLQELGASTEQRIGFLREKVDQLKGWVKDVFGVEDVQEWAEQVAVAKSAAQSNLISYALYFMPKLVDRLFFLQQQQRRLRKERKVRFIDFPLIFDLENPVSEEVKPPVLPLRIKLVDDKNKLTSLPVPPRGSGTGSKNLSRMMSRPSESTETKAKTAASQTPITVFWNYVEPFFKPIDENDIRALDDSNKFVDPTSFTIPPLGRHYEEHWKETFGYTCHGRVMRRRPAQNGCDLGNSSPPRVASLRERLLAMLIEENLTVPETSLENGNGEIPSPTEGEEHLNSPPPMETLKGINFVHVDERIRQELSQSGLCMFVPKIDYQEDDEICSEMRTLQRKLRQQVCLNHYRKRKLSGLIRNKLPAQEFYTLLADIDKQIEQAFSKRSKIQKQKKKKVSVTSPSPSPVSSQQLEPIPLVETRQKLLVAFSDIIPTQRDFLTPTAPPSLFDAEDEAKVVQYAMESGNWLPIPDQPLNHVKLSKPPAHPVFPALAGRERQSSIVFEPTCVL
jgi:hypothetical protein